MCYTAPVLNNEKLYRRIPNDRALFRIENGLPKFSATAFNDRYSEPSVDRARFRNNNPALTKLTPSDGVIALSAERVRSIGEIIQRNPTGKSVLVTHQIDVKPDPIFNDPELPDNPAHAKIYATPQFANQSVFKKLRESLARLVNDNDTPWEIAPTD